MRILSLKVCADSIGTSQRQLRYYLERESIIPYRRLELGGGKHVRWFAVEDLQTMKEWWNKKNAERTC